jgi:hypothetical protein
MKRVWALASGVACIVSALVAPGCDEEAVVAGDAAVVDAAPPACTDGETRCVGELQQVCINGGYADTSSPACCTGGTCTTGRDPCEVAASRRAYTGCEFWPVDLPNAVDIPAQRLPAPADCVYPSGDRVGSPLTAPFCVANDSPRGLCDFDRTCSAGQTCEDVTACVFDAQRSPFAVVVSNPDTATPANVVLVDAAGAEVRRAVAPGAVETIYPAREGLADQSLGFTGVRRAAYKLSSDLPVVAYQFNPLDNVDVFSNDGSLLLPSHAFDADYVALTLPTVARRAAGSHDYFGYLAIVASHPEGAHIRVTPTYAVRPGPSHAGLAAGVTAEFDLAPFEVLLLQGAPGGDLTGTRVEADGGRPVGVFVGHEAAQVSKVRPAPCCADHVEEQLFPESSWGASFAIARSEGRGANEPDWLRIVGSAAETRVRFDPPAGPGCPLLRPGEWCDVTIDGDTMITADAPVLVGHLLVSAGTELGDPALAFAPPVDQLRSDYALLVPAEYEANHLAIVAPAGSGAVMLDGVDVSAQLSAFGPGTYVAGRLPVTAGAHRVACPERCGVLVMGYGRDVSYFFAGGLDLARITDPQQRPR